jgi:hypothetical protein
MRPSPDVNGDSLLEDVDELLELAKVSALVDAISMSAVVTHD